MFLLKRIPLDYFLIFFLIIFSSYFRFMNLGYSDYIGDEHKSFLIPNKGQTVSDFLLEQRKGPMQFFVSYIPYSHTHDWNNELAERIPFSIFNVLSIVVFYIFLKNFTKHTFISFVSAILFSLNGFIIGFGRISQYQNLNLFFSFMSLYFFQKSKINPKYSIFGTLFFSLSLLSHWDAIFIIPVIVYLIKDLKLKYWFINIILGSLFLLPFLVPYVTNQSTNNDNSEYFTRRVDPGFFNPIEYKTLIELYNPFITFYLILGFYLISIIDIKKTYIFHVWFILTFLVFLFFVRKPGTHVYNFVIPAIICASYGIYKIYNLFQKVKILRFTYILLLSLVLMFITYQAHLIFVDYRIEYPWEREEFFTIGKKKEYYVATNGRTKYRVVPNTIKTRKYTIEEKLPLFGFLHKRYWEDIRDYIKQRNVEDNEKYGYMSNEVKTISEWYMDTNYKADGSYFVVGIKEPLSFSRDWEFPQIGNKKIVKEIKNEFDEIVVRIYEVQE